MSKSSGAISDTTAIRMVMSSGFPPVMLKPSHLACSENGEEKLGSNEWVLAKCASESVTFCMLSVLWSWEEEKKMTI